MPRKIRKKHRVCSNCNTRFTGRYCPYCGAENGRKHVLSDGGFFIGLLRFILSLILLALILAVVLIALDYIAAADNGAHTAAAAIVTSVKNALPQNVLTLYTNIKSAYIQPLMVWAQNLHNSFNIAP